jgi:putative glutamine amidotransferase
MTPIIGITPSSQTDTLPHGTFDRFYLTAAYVRAVTAAGGLAFVLPPQPGPVAPILDAVDGLILSGGADVEPARYGDPTVHEATYGVDPERDRFELALVAGALARDIPVFGICRGIQVLNVALGGTLIQDVATEHAGAAGIGHRQQERGLEAWRPGHQLTVAAPDRLPYSGAAGLGVNSFHHQAIRDFAPALMPTAYAPDGLIEAVTLDANPAVFAVQWHPELMFEHDPAHLEPFTRLVNAAATRKLAFA